MTKGELIKTIAAKTGLAETRAAFCLAVLLDTITTELKAGNDVALPGLGKLVVKERAERQGRNPQTGQTVTIPACKVVGLRAGKELKAAVNK